MIRLPLFPAGPPPAAADASTALRQNPSCERCDLHQSAIKRCLPPAAVAPGVGGLLAVSPYPDRLANATGQVWSDRAHRTALAATAPGAVVALTGPLCEGRPRIDGQDTAYVCRQFVCDAPTTDPEVLARQLR